MDDAVRPLTGRPLLVKQGPLLTRIVVDSVLALDGKRYAVMFIGTGKKTFLKVNLIPQKCFFYG